MIVGGDRLRMIGRVDAMSVPPIETAEMSMLKEAEFSMTHHAPEMIIEQTTEDEPATTATAATATTAVDPCAVWTKKKCRKNAICTWDGDACFTTPGATTTSAPPEEAVGQDIEFIDRAPVVDVDSESPTPSPSMIENNHTPFPTDNTRKLSTPQSSSGEYYRLSDFSWKDHNDNGAAEDEILEKREYHLVDLSNGSAAVHLAASTGALLALVCAVANFVL